MKSQPRRDGPFQRRELILYEKSFNLKTSGNEVYYTNSLILLIKMMLCGKIHGQKFFKLKLFSYKIEAEAEQK